MSNNRLVEQIPEKNKQKTGFGKQYKDCMIFTSKSYDKYTGYFINSPSGRQPQQQFRHVQQRKQQRQLLEQYPERRYQCVEPQPELQQCQLEPQQQQ